jgi:hypothetical protein
MNVVLLIAATFTCLALGVALAYAACNLMFACMRLRQRTGSVATATAKVAEIAKV